MHSRFSSSSVGIWNVANTGILLALQTSMICAMSALSTAHRSAGNRDEWLRWREAIRCQADGRPFPSDLGHPDWDAQRALGAALGYAAAPFAAPRNWAAFVLVGRG